MERDRLFEFSVKYRLLSFDNRGFRDESHAHPVHMYVVIGIVAWELSLQITRHLHSIDRKL